jgi:hypothetical protein
MRRESSWTAHCEGVIRQLRAEQREGFSTNSSPSAGTIRNTRSICSNAVVTAVPARHPRTRPTIYDDAVKQALTVLWETSDRVCGKRLKPLLRLLVPALERHGHLKLDEVIRGKVLSMSAATIDRLLRTARSATRARKPRRVTPEIRRRIRCERLPTGTTRLLAAWKWTWSHIVETGIVAAMCIA